MTAKLRREDMHHYQERCVDHVVNNPAAGLFLEMGLGKSCIALTAIDELLNNRLEIRRVLVIGTKKVCESVWQQEGAKWEHLKHLRFSLVLGEEKKRKAALKAVADVYVINRENVPWLIALCQGKFRWDMVVIDESSSFKNDASRRFQAIKQALPAAKRVVIMTGTPMPNTILDLWAQVYLLDRGKRLGDSFAKFKHKYFEKDPYKTFTYNLREGVGDVQQIVSSQIGDICISLQAKDYLELPPRVDRIVSIKLPADTLKKYEEFEEDRVLDLLNEEQITAINAAGLTNKLLQFANGAVYDRDKEWHAQHDEKLDRLEEIIEAANGQPVLVFYSFQSDLERIQQRIKTLRVMKKPQDVDDWNAGQIRVLAAHPASAGHGLNLQAGGNIIVWFGLNWSLELYQQGNARLMRQGQQKPVIIHHLLAEDTMDFEVYQVLQGKAGSQEALMQAVKARIEKYRKKL